MEQKIDDFNVILTKIIVAHKWVYDTSSLYDCSNGRKTYGLVHLLTGELDYRFSDGRRLKVKAGDTLLLKPTDGYRVTCPIKCHHYTINFQILASSIEGNATKNILLGKETSVLQQDTTQSRIDTLEQACSVWSEKEPGYQMKAIQLTYKFLHDFIKKQVSIYQNTDYIKLKPAIELLDKNWNTDISLDILAKACLLSVPHFRHLFARVFNTSPMKYRDSLRILHAKDYLLLENHSVADVASKCGFDDINYFSRFFKKHTGVSPSKYSTI